MTEAQEKNHTDPIDLSSRTPLGQLMQRAVMYTHQVGADGSTAPLPSRKKFSLFLVPPSYLEGPLSTNIMLIEKHVLPLWNIVMCTDGQSQLTYFLPSSTEFHLTPKMKIAVGELRVF